MAGRGPAPKDEEKRTRRHATLSMHEIPRGARVERAPRLPPAADIEERGDWLPATRRWYQRWVRSEQATQFTSVMWGRLHDLAYIVDDYYRTPSTGRLAEIRLNEAKLGATPEDMQRLRWRVIDPPADDSARRGRSRRRGLDPRHLAAVPDPT